jgi:hypothetical protein
MPRVLREGNDLRTDCTYVQQISYNANADIDLCKIPFFMAEQLHHCPQFGNAVQRRRDDMHSKMLFPQSRSTKEKERKSIIASRSAHTSNELYISITYLLHVTTPESFIRSSQAVPPSQSRHRSH